MDFQRKVIGYGLGRTLSADLAMAALLDAISKRNTDNLIHHSDQGIQYCSYDYVKILKDNGITISMSRKANPYDNAKIESFFRTLRLRKSTCLNMRLTEKFWKGSPILLKKSTIGKDCILLWAICPRKNLIFII